MGSSLKGAPYYMNLIFRILIGKGNNFTCRTLFAELHLLTSSFFFFCIAAEQNNATDNLRKGFFSEYLPSKSLVANSSVSTIHLNWRLDDQQ